MTMADSTPENAPLYEVRVTEPAEAEIESAYLGRMRYGLAAAERWYAGLARVIESLSQWPRRFPILPGDETRGEVRQMIYGKGQSAYRVLYRVIEPRDGESGIVRVLHVRHTARRLPGQSDENDISTF